MNTPYGEIIRGEVSIFRGGAGGSLYFSSGSVRGSLRMGAIVCPETLERESTQIRQRSRLAAERVEDFIEWVGVVKREVCDVNRRRLAIPNLESLIAPGRSSVTQNRKIVEEYSAILVTTLKPDFLATVDALLNALDGNGPPSGRWSAARGRAGSRHRLRRSRFTFSWLRFGASSVRAAGKATIIA